MGLFKKNKSNKNIFSEEMVAEQAATAELAEDSTPTEEKTSTAEPAEEAAPMEEKTSSAKPAEEAAPTEEKTSTAETAEEAATAEQAEEAAVNLESAEETVTKETEEVTRAEAVAAAELAEDSTPTEEKTSTAELTEQAAPTEPTTEPTEAAAPTEPTEQAATAEPTEDSAPAEGSANADASDTKTSDTKAVDTNASDTKAVDTKTGKKKKNKKAGKKRNKKIILYILGGIAVMVLAVLAVSFLRMRLLKTQLDLAASYMEAEQWDDAETAYEQALRIYHNSADAYMGLAEVSIGRGELTEALAILDRGIAETGSSNLAKSRDVIIDQVFATYVLDSYLINLLPGESAKISMDHRSEDMNFSLKWSSSDESIGTVDENGNIEALKNGTTKIVATIGNETWGYRDVSATLIVGVIVTYLQEQGCNYVTNPNGLMAPCFLYQENNEGYRIYDGTLEIEQGNATYSLTKCKVSDPDPEGYVTYDIEYKINVPTKFGILAGSKESKQAWYYNWMAEELILADDYTGQMFCVQDLYGEEGLIYDSLVKWNDMEYHITGTTENEWENKEEWAVTYSPLTTITWAEAPAIGTYKLKIKAPAEYDGLVLALDKHGITDYRDPEKGEDDEYDSSESFTDTFFFEPLEDGSVRKPQDYYIIKISDFAEKIKG